MKCNEVAAKMLKRRKKFVDTLQQVRSAGSRKHATTDFTDFTDGEFASDPVDSIRAIREIRGSAFWLRLAGPALCVELLSEIRRCQSKQFL
jgi:hypothetical protein